MFGIEGYQPYWMSGLKDIRAASAERVRALVGRRLTHVWVVWDIEDDTWLSDPPVLLDFGGSQVEVSHSKFNDLSIAWDRVDPHEPIRWPGFAARWRHDALPEVQLLQEEELLDVELLEWWGRDVARGAVAVSFVFPSGRVTVFNALDENGLDFGTPEPEYRRHSLR